jgi:signal transduction histidine kinase
MLAVLRVSGRLHGTILVAGRDRPFSEQEGQLLAVFAVPVILAIEDAELNQRLLDRSRQLAATQEELKRMTKVVESIRRPFTVVRGYLELLLDGVLGPVPEGQMATMNMLLAKTQDITSLVNQLSPSQQFLSDTTRYELIPLPDLVRRAVDTRSTSIKEASLDLVTQLPTPDDGECITAGNPDLLFNVFDALLDNAVKFSPNGGTIHISLHETREIVYVKIDDPGVGIPTQHLPQIWQPREQRGHSDSMSLAEVKQIVEEHGGLVWVESQPGRGSTFYVALPKIVSK